MESSWHEIELDSLSRDSKVGTTTTTTTTTSRTQSLSSTPGIRKLARRIVGGPQGPLPLALASTFRPNSKFHLMIPRETSGEKEKMKKKEKKEKEFPLVDDLKGQKEIEDHTPLENWLERRVYTPMKRCSPPATFTSHNSLGSKEGP